VSQIAGSVARYQASNRRVACYRERTECPIARTHGDYRSAVMASGPPPSWRLSVPGSRHREGPKHHSRPHHHDDLDGETFHERMKADAHEGDDCGQAADEEPSVADSDLPRLLFDHLEMIALTRPGLDRRTDCPISRVPSGSYAPANEPRTSARVDAEAIRALPCSALSARPTT
jgi:hypothetical protein